MLEELLAQLKEQQANNPEAGTEAALELNWDSLDAASQFVGCVSDSVTHQFS